MHKLCLIFEVLSHVVQEAGLQIIKVSQLDSNYKVEVKASELCRIGLGTWGAVKELLKESNVDPLTK